MFAGIMDNKESAHLRRQWVSQYQLENMKDIESELCERRKVLGRGEMIYSVMRYPVTVVMSLVVFSLMILNLNQSTDLHGYISANKVHHQSHGLRSLEKSESSNCMKTPLVTPQESAYSMPMTPPWYSYDKPSHISLCEELISRNDYVTNEQSNEGSATTSPFTKFVVHETSEFCADWSKPHSAMMQIISSSIIAYVGERFGLEYTHNCHNVLDASYRHNLNFDVTTVQEIFTEQKMPIDQKVLQLGEVVHELCVGCIEEYNNNNGAFDGSDASHHCMAFPDRGGAKTAIVAEQIKGQNGMPQMVQREAQVDSKGNVFHTALESVLPLVRNRLWHVARDWQNESKIPRGDPRTGAVIFIDADSSMPIPFHLYRQFIPPYITQIEIMSGPNCAKGKLAVSMSQFQSMSCLQHGAELRDYLHDNYQDQAVDVSFNLLSSTAAQYTRMIQTNTLICPPNTISCLFPALAKDKIKKAVLFEITGSSTYHWFNYLGNAVGNAVPNVSVVRLTSAQMAIDQGQAFVEAKYAGFSPDQLIGRKPAGLYRPSPGSPASTSSSAGRNGSTNTNAAKPSYTSEETEVNGRGSNNTPDLNPTVESFVQGESTVSTSLYETPDLNHLFDTVSNHNMATASSEADVTTERSSIAGLSSSSSSSIHLPFKQQEYNSEETSLESYEDKVTNEYELLETPETNLAPRPRGADLDSSSNEGEETVVNFEQSAMSEEANIGRSQDTTETDVLFNSAPPEGNVRSHSSAVDDSEKLTETEVEIDYQSLFHGN